MFLVVFFLLALKKLLNKQIAFYKSTPSIIKCDMCFEILVFHWFLRGIEKFNSLTGSELLLR